MNTIRILQQLREVPHTLVVVIIFLMPLSLFAQQTKVTVVESGFIFDTAVFGACHASTIVELSDGQLMAAWFGGAHEGSPDVCIWTSVKKTGSWSAPVKTADGVQPNRKQFACWNP